MLIHCLLFVTDALPLLTLYFILYRLLTRRQFLLDVASYLIRIVCALSLPLRPVNAQLYNTQEKQHLARLVDLMISAGLDWVPQQSHDTGDATYRLEP